MTAATLTLRFGTDRLRAELSWPRCAARAVALVLCDDLGAAAARLPDCILIAPHSHGPADDLAALRWLAEHAVELGASASNVIAVGGARATRAAALARDAGVSVSVVRP